MKKYHPNWAIVGLCIIGLIVLIVCVTAGIWLAHALGMLFAKWGACPDYFSDFLGGALGLTVGFILDKCCIESINQVFKYKKLMKIVKNELTNIKKIAYSCGDDESNKLTTENYLDGIQVKRVCIGQEGNETQEVHENLNFFSYENLNEKNIDLSSLADYNKINQMYEYILDDIVKTAETLSILANLPLAGQYNESLILQLSLVQKYIEQVADAEGNSKKRNWLLLQYYINNVIEVL